MKGITKAWTVATAVTTVIAFVVIFSIFFALQPSLSSRDSDQTTIVPEPLAPNLHNRSILLIANENLLRIAPDNDLYPGGVWYRAMTFNGTIPAPLIIANQGDTLKLTLKNEGKYVHSLNFHAGFGPDQALSGVVNAGENKTWTMKVNYPGAFLYHCDGDNLNGIWEHIADGMYGGVVVRSPNEFNATKEFYITFSEIYDTNAHAPFTENQSLSNSGDAQSAGSFDIGKFLARKPDLVLTNGMAFRYIPWIGTIAKIDLNHDAEVFHVKTGELTRWYLFNAGPRNNIAFNFGAGMVKEVVNKYDNNNNNTESSSSEMTSAMSVRQMDNNSQGYDEIVNIPPGSGTVIEVSFPQPGTYFGNDHDVGSILYGAGFVVVAE